MSARKWRHAADGSRAMVRCERGPRMVTCRLCGRGMREWHPSLDAEQPPTHEACGDFETVSAAMLGPDRRADRDELTRKAAQRRTDCELYRRKMRNAWGGYDR